MIVGIDEVGRGCYAGPLVVAAVLLGGAEIEGLTDSKKLTPLQREKLAFEVRQNALDIGIGWISNKYIDKYGLSWALKRATKIALSQIQNDYDEIIIDGIVKFVDDPRVTTLAKADLLIPSVSAASIIAKVARDRYMYKMHEVFPSYGFNSHVGYGTVAHQAAIKRYGSSPLHRMSWTPLSEESVGGKVESTIGRTAERFAATFLEGEGFAIVETNWRTKWCEIDIVAQKDGIIHFVEVKYRKSDTAGDGLAAITDKKLKQMRFAAEFWRKRNKHEGEASLSALSLHGKPIEIRDWLPNIS